MQRILPLAKKVAEEIVCEDAETLEEIILRFFEVTQGVAKFSCGYVKRGRFGGRSSYLDLANANDRRENNGWAHVFGG